MEGSSIAALEDVYALDSSPSKTLRINAYHARHLITGAKQAKIVFSVQVDWFYETIIFTVSVQMRHLSSTRVIIVFHVALSGT